MGSTDMNVLLCLLIHFVCAFSECVFNFSNENVTFDLSPLTLDGSGNPGYYSTVVGDYEYIFNICEDCISVPNDSNCLDGSTGVYVDGYEETRSPDAPATAFQSRLDGDGCWRMGGGLNESILDGHDVITSQLFSDSDPSFGIVLHFAYGDECGSYNNRDFELAFICDEDVTNIPDSGELLYEHEQCGYRMEVNSIYGCPLECTRDVNGKLCSEQGRCSYDHNKGTAKCYCHDGYTGSACNVTTDSTVNVTKLENLDIDMTSQYVYNLTTNEGFNIIYDLSFIADGQLQQNATKYYQLSNFYFSLTDNFTGKIDDDYCYWNDENYDYTMMYQGSSTCYSFGFLDSVELYDEYEPTKGVVLKYEGGDSLYCDEARRAEVYLLCPNTGETERYDSENGLNDLYSNFEFVSEYGSDSCEYGIEIETVAACPIQCTTLDENKDWLSHCSNNGVCDYDKSIDNVRCLCNEDSSDIYCELDTTYAPTEMPTDDPTNDPTSDPTDDPTSDPTYEPTMPSNEPTHNPTSKPTSSPSDQYSLWGTWTHRANADTSVFLSFSAFVDIDCNYVKFEMQSPACNDQWFGVGIGGDYGYDSPDDISDSHSAEASESHSASAEGNNTETPGETETPEGSGSESESHELEGEAMNGYALISLTNELNINSTWASDVGYAMGIYESDLYAGATPMPQLVQNLKDCEVVIDGCTRTTVCYRSYYGNGTDFYKFVKGSVDIIWAFGDVDSDGYPNEHAHGHEDHSEIWMYGSGDCGYALEVSGESQEEKENGEDSSDSDVWMAVAIVFIILFIIVVIAAVYFIIKSKKQDTGGQSSWTRTQSNDDDNNDTTQMIDFNTSGNAGQTSRNYE